VLVKFGLLMSATGEFSNVRLLGDVARDAETGGWDGIFLFDLIQPFAPGTYQPLADPWLALMAIALATKNLRIGTLVTAVARRRPAKLARETATIDRASDGRFVLGVGLGYGPVADPEFVGLGESSDPRVRAAKLDEGLEVLTGLWSGKPYSHAGDHFQVHETVFLPTPVQTPRIPIWVGGEWPNHRPMRRAARFDGVFPVHKEWARGAYLLPEDIRAVKTYIAEQRDNDEPFDVVFSPSYPDNQPLATPDALWAYAESGATWWLENLTVFDRARKRAREGPPTLK
jgi:alkanesulfonate monooxygenase SsuD/methylene tetrahydromethanopterin reductase-like flavin-dependent oxidoreductase (luciferase family)